MPSMSAYDEQRYKTLVKLVTQVCAGIECGKKPDATFILFDFLDMELYDRLVQEYREGEQTNGS